MRKRILGFALIISILTSLFVGIAVKAAEAAMPVNIRAAYCYYADGKVKVPITFKSANAAGTVFLAVYNNGQLVKLKQEELAIKETKKTIVIENADESYLGNEIKAFCWGGDNSVTPISNSVDIQFETEIVVKMKLVSDEIDLYTDRSNPSLYTVFTNTERYILRKINVCIDDAVENHAEELDADFVEREYEIEINEVKGVYDEMTEGAKEAFKGKLAGNLDTDNLFWLADTLGIDLSEYGINKDDYI